MLLSKLFIVPLEIQMFYNGVKKMFSSIGMIMETAEHYCTIQ